MKRNDGSNNEWNESFKKMRVEGVTTNGSRNRSLVRTEEQSLPFQNIAVAPSRHREVMRLCRNNLQLPLVPIEVVTAPTEQFQRQSDVNSSFHIGNESFRPAALPTHHGSAQFQRQSGVNSSFHIGNESFRPAALPTHLGSARAVLMSDANRINDSFMTLFGLPDDGSTNLISHSSSTTTGMRIERMMQQQGDLERAAIYDRIEALGTNTPNHSMPSNTEQQMYMSHNSASMSNGHSIYGNSMNGSTRRDVFLEERIMMPQIFPTSSIVSSTPNLSSLLPSSLSSSSVINSNYNHSIEAAFSSNVLANALSLMWRSTTLDDNCRQLLNSYTAARMVINNNRSMVRNDLLHSHAALSSTSMVDIQQPSQPVSSLALVLPVGMTQTDDWCRLSPQQRFLREQIEYFEADHIDINTPIRGRNKPITVGQVGIRCKHCAHVHVSRRQKGSTYFPSNKSGLYQAAQNMTSTHLQCGLCNYTPDCIKNQFALLMAERQRNDSNSAGRPYWTKSATQTGLIDTDEHGIRFLLTPFPVGARVTEIDRQMLEA